MALMQILDVVLLIIGYLVCVRLPFWATIALIPIVILVTKIVINKIESDGGGLPGFFAIGVCISFAVSYFIGNLIGLIVQIIVNPPVQEVGSFLRLFIP